MPNRVIAIATQLNNRPADGMANLGALFQSSPAVTPNRVVMLSAPKPHKPNNAAATPNRVIAIATQVNNRPAVMSNLMGGSKPPRITLMSRPPVKVVQRQRVTSNDKMKLEWPISEIPRPISRQQA